MHQIRFRLGPDPAGGAHSAPPDGTWTFRILDCSYRGLFVPSWTVCTCSYPLGLFVPWTVRTVLGLFVPWTLCTVDYSYPPRLFVPWTIRTITGRFVRDARLIKINVSYQKAPMFSVCQPPWIFRTFPLNGWDFLVQILLSDYTFLSTLDYKFLFNYLQPDKVVP